MLLLLGHVCDWSGDVDLMIKFIRLLVVRVAELFEVLSLLFIPLEVVNFCAFLSFDQSPSVVIINKVDRNFFSVVISFIL